MELEQAPKWLFHAGEPIERLPHPGGASLSVRGRPRPPWLRPDRSCRMLASCPATVAVKTSALSGEVMGVAQPPPTRRRRPGRSGLIHGAVGPLSSRTTSRQPVVTIELAVSVHPLSRSSDARQPGASPRPSRSPLLWANGCERSSTQANETTTETRCNLCLIRWAGYAGDARSSRWTCPRKSITVCGALWRKAPRLAPKVSIDQRAVWEVGPVTAALWAVADCSDRYSLAPAVPVSRCC